VLSISDCWLKRSLLWRMEQLNWWHNFCYLCSRWPFWWTKRWGEKAWVCITNLHQMSFCACVVYWARPLSRRAGSLGQGIVREMVRLADVIFHTCRPHKLIQDQQWNQPARCFTTSQWLGSAWASPTWSVEWRFCLSVHLWYVHSHSVSHFRLLFCITR